MEEGDKKAGRMLKMVEEPSGFLSTIQIGITLAGFLGSAFAAENFSDPAGPVDYTGPGLYRYFDEHTKYAFSGADYHYPFLLYSDFR